MANEWTTAHFLSHCQFFGSFWATDNIRNKKLCLLGSFWTIFGLFLVNIPFFNQMSVFRHFCANRRYWAVDGCVNREHVDPDFSKDSKFSKKRSRRQIFTNELLKLAPEKKLNRNLMNAKKLVPKKILMNNFSSRTTLGGSFIC
jgi:hypothetical protein